MYEIPTTRFVLTLQADHDLYFYNYAGSTLRGVFGRALKDMACPNQDDKGSCLCQRDNPCIYRSVFEPFVPKDSKQTPTPPMIIEAHSLPTRLVQGETASFYMVLFGEHVHHELIFIRLAWERALKLGFSHQHNKAHTPSTATLVSFEPYDVPRLVTPKSSLCLELMTPMRLQHHGKLLSENELTAPIFCVSLLRKVRQLAQLYGTPMSDDDFDKLYQDAQKVQGKYQLYKSQLSRYSNRQHQKISQDGLLGCMEFYHVSDELYQVLHLGQWLHVGKGGVFGLGAYRIL